MPAGIWGRRDSGLDFDASGKFLRTVHIPTPPPPKPRSRPHGPQNCAVLACAAATDKLTGSAANFGNKRRLPRKIQGPPVNPMLVWLNFISRSRQARGTYA